MRLLAGGVRLKGDGASRVDSATYGSEDVALRVVSLEGRLALAAHVARAAKPAYFIRLDRGRVVSIRDFRYVPCVAAEAEFVGV